MNWLYGSSPDRQDTGVTRRRATEAIASTPQVTVDKDAFGTQPFGTRHRLSNFSIVTPSTPEISHSLPIQPKLTVSQPNDPYEVEADHVAETVLRMPEAGESGTQSPPFGRTRVVTRPIGEHITPWVQRQSVSTGDEQEDEVPGPTESMAANQVVGKALQLQTGTEEPEQQTEEQSVQDQESEQSVSVQTKRIGRSPTVSPVLEASLNRTQGQGTVLPAGPRQFFEPRFGHDFSRVRVHADGAAAQAAHSLNAQAFTRGSDIYFNAGRYQPQSDSGRHLLAHELTHVVQQGAGIRISEGVRTIGDRYERQADAVADSVVAGRDSKHLLGAYSGRANSRPSASPVIQCLGQDLPYVGPLFSYLNPVNQIRRLFMPGLSKSQKSLLDGIFGSSLSTSIIRLNPNSIFAMGNCYRTTGNVINMPGTTISDSHLIHEAAHVWQSQNTIFGVGYAISALKAQAIAQVLGGNWQRAYDYKKVEKYKIPWRYWNAEQQAQWIQDHRRLPWGWMLQVALPNLGGVESSGIE